MFQLLQIMQLMMQVLLQLRHLTQRQLSRQLRLQHPQLLQQLLRLPRLHQPGAVEADNS